MCLFLYALYSRRYLSCQMGRLWSGPQAWTAHILPKWAWSERSPFLTVFAFHFGSSDFWFRCFYVNREADNWGIRVAIRTVVTDRYYGHNSFYNYRATTWCIIGGEAEYLDWLRRPNHFYHGSSVTFVLVRNPDYIGASDYLPKVVWGAMDATHRVCITICWSNCQFIPIDLAGDCHWVQVCFCRNTNNPLGAPGRSSWGLYTHSAS